MSRGPKAPVLRAFGRRSRAPVRDAGLSDSGLADQHHDRAAAGERLVGGGPQTLELTFATDEDPAREAVERVRA